MAAAVKHPALSEAEIAARLARDLPGWSHSGGYIRRKFRTGEWKGALMLAAAAAHLAEAAWHHPDLIVTYSGVEVLLQSHDAKGITEKDFALARKIDEVLLWRPGAEGGALEGTPADVPYVRHG